MNKLYLFLVLLSWTCSYQAAFACEETTQLEQAVQNHDAKKVKDLLSWHFISPPSTDVNEIDCYGSTALHIAASCGTVGPGAPPTLCRSSDTEIIETLIAKGANVDSSDASGGTPLMTAASFGHTDIVNLLIKAKAKLNTMDSTGFTALIDALWNSYDDSNLATTKALIAAGADLNLTKQLGTPLTIAAGSGNIESTKALIAAGADINAGVDPPITAASTVDIVRTLIAAGASLNSKDIDGDTALMNAVGSGDSKLALYLLSVNSTAINDQNYAGDTALNLAIEFNQISNLEHRTAQFDLHILISAGANLDVTAPILNAAADYSEYDDFIDVSTLASAGANLNVRNKDGDTALILATGYGHHNSAKILIDSGANPDILGNHGFTALIVAASNGDLEIIKALIAAKANLNICSSFGGSALWIAKNNGYDDAAKLIANSGGTSCKPH